MLLTVRTVDCHSYCVAQTRAILGPRAGTEPAGRENQAVGRRRERGDALHRGSHHEPLRRNLGRRSRNSFSITQSSKSLLVKRFSLTSLDPRRRPINVTNP